jgi:5-methylcytosine-specific restriction endonuclease McrA
MFKSCLMCGNEFQALRAALFCGHWKVKGTCAYKAYRKAINRYNRTHKETRYPKSGGTSRKKAVILKRDNYQCQLCHLRSDVPSFFDVDHKDSNHKNNDKNNLWTLCPNCHRLKTLADRSFYKHPWMKKPEALGMAGTVASAVNASLGLDTSGCQLQ